MSSMQTRGWELLPSRILNLQRKLHCESNISRFRTLPRQRKIIWKISHLTGLRVRPKIKPRYQPVDELTEKILLNINWYIIAMGSLIFMANKYTIKLNTKSDEAPQRLNPASEPVSADRRIQKIWSSNFQYNQTKFFLLSLPNFIVQLHAMKTIKQYLFNLWKCQRDYQSLFYKLTKLVTSNNYTYGHTSECILHCENKINTLEYGQQ